MKRTPGRLPRAIQALIRRLSLDETTVMIATAVVVGILGGLGAILFRWLVQLFQGLVIGRGDDVLPLLAQVPWWQKVLLPVAGGIVVGPLVHLLAREARGHGVPEVINAVVFKNGVIRPIVAGVKITASAITIAFGGSVGREGPIIQIGAALASGVGQWLRYSPQRLRTLIGCGAAAGIAATFNAPIAGVFFALEVILRDFALVTFSPIIVSSVAATAISRHFLGEAPAFPVPGFSLVSAAELPLYVFLGVLAGLLSVLYVRSLYRSEELFDRVRFPTALKPVLGGLPLGLLILVFPQVYGIGYSSMVRALEGEMSWPLMVLLLPAKLLAVCLTLGSGFSGGIFAPALFLGGMAGGAYGSLVGQLFAGHAGAVGAYAMIGMAAVVAAATGGPLTAILILFEMTGEYRIILPLMLACITANLVHRSLLADSIFTLRFTLLGKRLNFGRESAILQSYHVQDVMEVNPATIPLDYGFDKILKLFLGNPDDHYYVVDAERRLAGRITIHDVKAVLHAQNLGKLLMATDLCSPVPRAVHQRDTLEDCLLALGEHDAADLPVLESAERPFLVGIVTRRAVFEVYNREVLHKEVLGIKLVHGEARMRECVELPPEYRVQILVPPAWFAGRTLRQLRLRERFACEVIAVQRKEGAETRNELPAPDRPLSAADRLYVVGHVDDLARLLAAAQRPC